MREIYNEDFDAVTGQPNKANKGSKEETVAPLASRFVFLSPNMYVEPEHLKLLLTLTLALHHDSSTSYLWESQCAFCVHFPRVPPA